MKKIPLIHAAESAHPSLASAEASDSESQEVRTETSVQVRERHGARSLFPVLNLC
jgi:hypothetical protein